MPIQSPIVPGKRVRVTQERKKAKTKEFVGSIAHVLRPGQKFTESEYTKFVKAIPGQKPYPNTESKMPRLVMKLDSTGEHEIITMGRDANLEFLKEK